MDDQKNKPSLWQLFKLSLNNNTQQDFTQGSIGIAAFLLAVPMVLEMAMESVFAIVDIFFVSALGFAAVAVVGLTEAVLTLIYAIAIGLSMGVTALVARRIGQKQPEQANTIAGQALWLGFSIALAIALIGSFYAADILRLMGADEAVLAMGESYTTIMLCSAITILYLFIINAIFRGAGDASIAMRSLWIANGINIILDPIFIFGLGPIPEMGVTGAAIATSIGRGIGVLYQLWHLFGVAGRIQVRIAQLRIQLPIIQQLIRVSMGGMLQFLIATASWVILMRIVSLYGSEAVAGYTIAIRVVMFSILPAWGLSNAVATLVGQNLGAGKPDRAERSVWVIARYNIIFMLTVALLFIVFAPDIIVVFNDDPGVLQSGIDCLRMVAYGYGFFALGMVLVQAFNGAGDTMTPTRINFFCYWLIQIPLAYCLAVYFELQSQGVYVAVLAAESLIAVFGYLLFRTGRWKQTAI
ncbi:MATE family efflux transporter [Planctobacterium marinum]|uniref:Multidrug-efflux transporter n=1 Tax=Planctobacterium marinum TaxID=1631968 RepID=A0AA48I2J2_9ALTE|nr:MATE family efflux transporter [Planctobacterium marinum]